MAGYIRQSTFVDGDTITASLFNNEYNQLVNSFSNTSGHKHDGTTAEGPVIGLIGDAGETSPNNKVLIDTTNNYIEFYVQVSDSPVQQMYIADGAIIPTTDSDVDLGTTGLRFKDAYIDTVTTTGNVAVGGNLTVTGTTTFNGGTITMGDAATDNVVFGADVDSNIIPDDDDSYDLGSSTQEWRDLYIDGTAHIDTLDVDVNATIAGTLGVTGVLTGTSLDISGDIDVDGTTNLDVVDIDGAVDMATTLTVGGEITAASLDISGNVDIDGVLETDALSINSTTVTSTAAELNILDGVTASAADINLIDGITNGTVIASKAIVTDANIDITGGRNITISGELDAATLDISGDADIDGTLEADAITIGGITLAETISDTVGAMVASNTETGIAVTYDDADNTLDFVIGDNAIVQSMIADNAIDSQMYVDGSIDTAHYAANSITGAELADNIDIAGTLDVTGVLTADSNVVIAGNLTVQGDTTTLNTATLDVEDKNITLNKGAGDTSGSANGAGLTIQDAVDASNDATILWDTTNDEFDFSHPINVAGKVTSTGTSVFASLDISGDVDVDGTLETDALSIASTTITATAAELNILDGVTSTAAEINLLDGKAFLDEDNMASNSATGIASQQSIKAYVDSEVGSIVSDVVGDTTPQLGGDLDLNSNDITGTGNINITGTIQSSGNITGTLATAAQPNITSLGTLTGFTSTGIDDNATSTAITIDSSENVGIGASSPDTLLELSKTAGTGTSLAKLANTSSAATSNISQIDFELSNTFSGANVDVQIGAVKTNAGNEESAFYINTTSGTGTPTERMRIRSDGGVGINSSGYAGQPLTVNAGSGDYVFYGESTDAICKASFRDNSSTANIEFGASGNNHIFSKDGATQMTIDSSGLVGIGQTPSSSDGSMLQITGADGIQLKRSGQTNGFVIRPNASTDGIRFTQAGTGDRMTIDSSGNVGIGTSSITTFDGYKTLHFKNTGGNAIALTESDGGVISQTIAKDSGGGQVLIGARSNHPTVICQNDTERMRIDSSGNVGIGTSSPSTKLEVAGDVKLGAVNPMQTATNVVHGTSGQDGFLVRTAVSGATAPTYSNIDDTNTGMFFAAADTLGFTTAGSEKMRINDTGKVLINNTDATPKGVLNVRGAVAGAVTTMLSFDDMGTRGAGTAQAIDFIMGRSGFISEDACASIRGVSEFGSSTSASHGINLEFYAGVGTTQTRTLKLRAFGSLTQFNTDEIPTHGNPYVSNSIIIGPTTATGLINGGLTTACALYNKSGELYATDSSHNNTQLTPHNWELIDDGPSEELAWTYWSQRPSPEDRDITQAINVDIAKVVRKVEDLVGEKLIYTQNSNMDDHTHQNIIADIQTALANLTTRIEALES